MTIPAMARSGSRPGPPGPKNPDHPTRWTLRTGQRHQGRPDRSPLSHRRGDGPMDSTNRPPWARPCSSWISRRSPRSADLESNNWKGLSDGHRWLHPRQPSGPLSLPRSAPERLHERLHRAAPRPLPAAGASVDVNGFKFFYELLAISRGRLQVGEIPLRFQPLLGMASSISLLWDCCVPDSLATLRLAAGISFGLVGPQAMVVQLLSTAPDGLCSTWRFAGFLWREMAAARTIW